MPKKGSRLSKAIALRRMKQDFVLTGLRKEMPHPRFGSPSAARIQVGIQQELESALKRAKAFKPKGHKEALEKAGAVGSLQGRIVGNRIFGQTSKGEGKRIRRFKDLP